ncbi:uncharacterized protein PV09_09799 [Verruconis gallopava]|uniref:Uncharacterized protein n=1 Tax=Verruconis gallopava TaxID=253628 RepID=A0A0D2AHE5_9PEZI|nr:uncharacterized protein PV09_09799 [Verruconis gallopava]KIV98363.1 hypothetical protein PV09_09799 [Verruconis gallopava]
MNRMPTPSRSLLRYLRGFCYTDAQSKKTFEGCYAFSTTVVAASGHSKWATIKHDKAKVDMKRNKQRSMLAQQIELMSKLYGPDLDANPRLKTVVADAKRQGLPKDVLEAAIKRGQGLSTTGKPLESLTIEAVFAGGVAAIIECSTETKAKTLMDVRNILTKHSGNQSPVQFLFKRRGIIVLKHPLPEGVTVEGIMECALEVDGFEDIDECDNGTVELVSEPNAVRAVADAVVGKLGVDIQSLEITWQAMDLVDPPPDNALLIESAVKKIEEMAEVQQVYLNMRRGEGAAARS